MKVTTSCELMEVESDILTDYTEESTEELTLDVKLNCGTPLTLTIEFADLVAGKFNIEPATLGMTTFDDGVYSFTLQSQSGEIILQEFACVFRDCDTRCQITNATEAIKSKYKISNFKDFNKITDPLEKEAVFNIMYILQLYSALTFVGTCAECTCDRGCEIWCVLQKLIGNNACFGC